MFRVVIAFLVFIFIKIGLIAQCDPSVMPSADEKLAYRPRGNRCEGFFSPKIAAHRIRIVSFTLGEVRFEADPSEVIEVKAPVEDLKLQAIGIPNDLYYRMDVELRGNSLQWPVSDVLYQNDQSKLARNIGILAFKQEGKDKVYYPVNIQGKKTALSEPAKTIILKIVSTTRLAQVAWKIDKTGEKYRPVNGSSFKAFTPVYIRIPADLVGFQSIVIRAVEESSPNPLFLNIKVRI